MVVIHLVQIKNANNVVKYKVQIYVKEVITHQLDKVYGENNKLPLLLLNVMKKIFAILQINQINIYTEIIYVKKDILEHYANLVIIMGIF